MELIPSEEFRDSRGTFNEGSTEFPAVVSAAAAAAGNSSHPLPVVDDQLRAAIIEVSSRDGDLWSVPDRDRRESVHALFQYPAMMVPAVQRQLVGIITGLQPHVRTIFDPFVGAATSLVAGMPFGLDCYGLDINPLAILVSRVKTGPFTTASLRNQLNAVLRYAREDASERVEADFPNLDKWFRPEATTELSRLRRAIRRIPSPSARRFLWVALAETIRLTSNDRTSTYKLHARSAADIAARTVSPLTTFAEIAIRNMTDLEAFRSVLSERARLRSGHYTGTVHLDLCNTLELRASRRRYDLLVSSPPYGDNNTTVTYGQHSYLPLQWIDLDDIHPEAEASYLRTTQEIDRRSLGGKQSAKRAVAIIDVLRQKSAVLSDTFERLKDKPSDRLARVASFYSDLDKALGRIVKVMKPNAYLVWVVGNRSVGKVEIPTDKILTELLGNCGVVEVGHLHRTIHHKRMPIRNDTTETMGKERILILRTAAGRTGA